jgi:hypothetical protein
MLAFEHVRKAIADETFKNKSFDRREFSRLLSFIPLEEWASLGYRRSEDPSLKYEPHVIKEWSRDNVLAQLGEDLAFAFEKALGRRGISSHSMYCVVKMWMWILEEPELSKYTLDEDGENKSPNDDYTYYGLPFFKAVALKFGLPNPIGDDTGSEESYSDE